MCALKDYHSSSDDWKLTLCYIKKSFLGVWTRVKLSLTEDESTPPKILTLAAFPMYLTGGFTQTPQNLSILWLQFQLMHTLFLLERERFPLATSEGLFCPGAVTVASHTRMNLKRQVNCCSLRINRAIYSACLFGFFSLLLLPFLGFSIFLCSSFFPNSL